MSRPFIRLFLKGFVIAAILFRLLPAQAAYAASNQAHRFSPAISFAASESLQSPQRLAPDDLKQHNVDAWQQIIALNPTNATAWNNLGQTLFTTQQYSEALTAYDHALLINPAYSLALANRCGVLSQLENYDQALVSCDLALAGDKQWVAQGSARAGNNRGDALFNLKQYQASLRSFEKAILINPNSQNAWYNRALVLSELGQ
ncbi:MAG: tetratricopeptide repeat protein [Phormidesmis sp.]